MRIWTGRAGSGKTTAILREIAALSEKGEGRQILLVPELNSHLMERRLAAATHNHGARTAEVLTFSRLADRVFSEVGGLAQQMLTPAGQLLTLQEAARRVQGGLSAWKGLADKPELLQEALRLIDECKTCAVAPETLFAAAEESEDAVPVSYTHLQAVTNADRTIISIKRHMGTDYRVNIDGKPYSPQEISAMILQKLKDVYKRQIMNK